MFKAKKLNKLVAAGIITQTQKQQILEYDDNADSLALVSRALMLLGILPSGWASFLWLRPTGRISAGRQSWQQCWHCLRVPEVWPGIGRVRESVQQLKKCFWESFFLSGLV